MLRNSLALVIQRLNISSNSFSLKLIIRTFFLFASLFFIFHSVIKNSAQISLLSLDKGSILLLALAISLSLFSLIINAFAWKSLLIWLGYKVEDLKLIRLFLSSNLLKYLPGGVWHFIERIRVLRDKVPTEQALTAVFLEPLLMTASALCWVPFGGIKNGFEILYFIPAILLFSFFREPIIRAIKRLKANQISIVLSGKERVEPVNFLNQKSSNYPLRPLVIEMLFVLTRFIGFFFCLKAFSIDQSLVFFECLAAFSFAWTVGLLVPGAPGGIGIFEATLLFRLGGTISEATLIGALLCYRVITTFSDLLAAFFSGGISIFLRIKDKAKFI